MLDVRKAEMENTVAKATVTSATQWLMNAPHLNEVDGLDRTFTPFISSQ